MQRKLIGLVLVAALIMTSGFGVFAGNGNGNDKANNGKSVANAQIEQTDSQKIFKAELNAQKKIVAKAKGALEDQKLALSALYDAAIAAGDAAGAEALLVQITSLDTEIAVLQAQMKQIINERYMIIKTLYTDEELAQFANAAAVIEQMYADASVLGIGSIIVRDNIIKFDAPAYIKGGRTIIPVRAITEELGATVLYDPLTQSVSITKDNIVIILTIGSTKVLVDGVEQLLDTTAEITNGRTYVPLRFIAETFGLTVDFDDETEIIDIEEPDVPDVPDETDETDETDELVE